LKTFLLIVKEALAISLDKIFSGQMQFLVEFLVKILDKKVEDAYRSSKNNQF
jgi:hypothetical protein